MTEAERRVIEAARQLFTEGSRYLAVEHLRGTLAALDALADTGEVEGWRSIETAPKDPRLDGILVWCPSKISPDGGWSFKARWGYHDDTREYVWLIADIDDPDFVEGATHWMPLPSPPTTGEG